MFHNFVPIICLHKVNSKRDITDFVLPFLLNPPPGQILTIKEPDRSI